jgi:hypothetical protein
MKIKEISIFSLLIILLASMVAFGSNVFLGPYFDDTYFDLSDDALILKVVPHEKGGLETDVSAYDGLLKISGGSTSQITDNSINWDIAYGWGDHSGEGYLKVITGESIGDLSDVDLTDIANEKILQYNFTSGNWECKTAPAGNGGYTDLIEFVDQTAWRLFYSNNLGDVTELALGTDGQYLKSTGATSAPIFDTPAGAGTVTTSGTPEINDIARFIGATVIEGLSYAEFKAALDLEIGTDLQAYSADNAFRTDKLNVFASITEAELYTVLSDVDEFIEAGDAIERNYYSVLDSDNTYSSNADVDSQPVGETVTFGDLLYFNWADKEWKKTDADAAATMPGLRIALEGKDDSEICLMLVKGYIRDDNAFAFAGAMVYASVTPGAMSSTAPTETGDQVQRVGVAKSADILFFDPSIDVGEI